MDTSSQPQTYVHARVSVRDRFQRHSTQICQRIASSSVSGYGLEFPHHNPPELSSHRSSVLQSIKEEVQGLYHEVNEYNKVVLQGSGPPLS